MKNYTQYRVEDFVLDDYFRDWVLNKSTSSKAFWQEWLKTHPEKRPVVEEAREILLALQPDQPQINPGEMEEGFREISDIYRRIFCRHRKRNYKRALWIAIAGLLLILTWMVFV